MRQLASMHHPILARTPMNVQQLQSSQQKSTGAKSQSCSKRSSNLPSQENFLAFGGCLECETYCITALGWLKKEEDEQFTTHCY